jgi:prolyl-tRNA synthetase
MTDQRLPARDSDFAEWYNQLVLRADLADYAPVRGCMIIKPYGWALWENIQAGLDRRFKATGHVNAAFPMLIPKSFLDREASHVEGFAPELAVVTHGGGEALEEPLVVRPTSETVIGHMYAKWIKSYRDLPVLINQWCSVLRWELRTKLFLRTAEFWWQEGHTAHATQAEAQAEARQMLDVYADFMAAEAAIPVVPGRKSESERFPGAEVSLSIEAMMGDRRALQAGTSHDFGQKFARAFEIRYLDRNNALQYCWTTSWGFSTRGIGAIIMVHGDDQGLILPPRLAPHQAVLVPIYKNDLERGPVLETVERLKQDLLAAGVRLRVDDRDGLTPGFKFHDWELRGVPLRIEVGPKDVAQGGVALARRDQPGRQGKRFIPQAGLAQAVAATLDDIHAALYNRALAFRRAHTFEPADYAEFQQAVERGWAYAWWCGDAACEAAIQDDTRATSRCIPFDQPGGHGVCIRCGGAATEKAYFARAY